MRGPAGLRVAAAGVAACLVTSCSTVGDLLARDEDAGPKVARIVVLTAPEDGPAGAGVLAAVQLAIEDRALAIPDWTVEVVAADDTTQIAETADTLAEDDDVIAVVGGLSGEVVRAVQPALGRASILFISPADVGPEHTRGSDPAAPLRPYASYFRTAVPRTDAVNAAADYAVAGLGARSVAVVDGGGSGDAARFAAEVRRLGAKVVAMAPAGADGTGIDTVMAAAYAADAEVVFTAADPAVAVVVAKKLAGTGLDARLVGGDTLRSADFAHLAGTAADGAVAVVPATLQLADGGESGGLAARLAQVGTSSAGPFAAAVYDAGTAIGEVLTRCLPAEDTAAAAREACVAEMQQVSFAGVTGEVSFDSYGDRAGSHPQVWELRDGEWVEIGAA